jgi:cyanate permease
MSQNTPLTNSSDQRPAGARRRQRALVVAALALTGFGLRVGVTSVGSVLGSIQGGLHTDSIGMGSGRVPRAPAVKV